MVAAMGAAEADLTHYTDEPVPAHLRDTSYRGADKLEAGKGYQYPLRLPGPLRPRRICPRPLPDISIIGRGAGL